MSDSFNVDSCPPLGLCRPPLHGPDSGWDCRRVLHKTPPKEFDRHDPSDRGLHSSRCTRLNCEVLYILQLCFNAASTASARTKSDVISHTMHVLSLLRNCSLASNSAVPVLRFLLRCCEQASKMQSAVSHFRHGWCVSFFKQQGASSSSHWHLSLHHNKHVYHSQTENCTGGTSTVF